MRAIVTGGAGFIGSHVVDALLGQGHEVHVLDDLSKGRRDRVAAGAELHVADIREPDAVFEAARPGLVFHLAAQADVRVSVERPSYDADVNVLGTVQVLEAARRHGARVVFASTGGAIYGECERPAPEDAPRRPLAPYGTSKLCGEEYLATWNRLHGTSHVSLRFGNIYGPRQEPHGEAGVVAIFMGLLQAGGTPKIYGDGRQTRDYVYVGDVVAANLAAASSDAGGAFNIGLGVESTVLDIVEILGRLGGRDDFEAEHAPERPGEIRHIALDASRAREELGWESQVQLEKGLERTLASVRG